MPDELTDTGRKMIFSDHDILLQVKTTLDIMLAEQRDFRTKYELKHEGVIQRITELEVKQAAHVEQTKTNTEDIAGLQKRSNLFDVLNGAATAVVAAFAVFWGGSK